MSRELASIGALCHHVVDYAGTFPPAELGLAEAVANYARYRESAEAWFLHRFVIAARDLDELALLAPEDTDWPLSVVCRDADDVERALAWTGGTGVVASLEVKDPLELNGEAFIERPLPIAEKDLTALRERNVMLKIRLGGASVPASGDVACALSTCARLGLSLKATAGLHQAIRSNAHGFVNVLLAAALARADAEPYELERLLDDTDASAFTFAADHITWRDRNFTIASIESGRSLLRSFGSCSFEEPLESLEALGVYAR